MPICPGGMWDGPFAWIRCRSQVRKDIQEIFRMNGDGDKRSNKRTEKNASGYAIRWLTLRSGMI
jgi:hypothetical protein